QEPLPLWVLHRHDAVRLQVAGRRRALRGGDDYLQGPFRQRVRLVRPNGAVAGQKANDVVHQSLRRGPPLQLEAVGPGGRFCHIGHKLRQPPEKRAGGRRRAEPPGKGGLGQPRLNEYPGTSRIIFQAARAGRSYSVVIGRITRHGFPAASTPGGTSFVTTAPAPMTAPSPMRTPGRMMAPPPAQTSLPMYTGLADSRPARRAAASSGWVAV